MRELGAAEIEELLRSQLVGRIGCHADGLTYVVPVIFALSDGCIYVASIEGQKIRMMRANPRVCFEVDEYVGPGTWRSAIVQGVYEELDEAGSGKALELLRARFAGAGEGGRRPRPAGESPAVWFRIRISEATGRAVAR